MFPENKLLSNNFYFPRFGSYMSFELHVLVCDWKSLWTLIFNLSTNQSKLSSISGPTEPEFFVRTLYDGFPIKYKFCGFQEFCPLSRFLEFLELNIYNRVPGKIPQDLAFKKAKDQG